MQSEPRHSNTPALPLEGITVVSVEQAVAAPMASRHLADLGARVIKVERPGGGDFAREQDTTVNGQSSHFVWNNRNKESITLDLKDRADLLVLEQLIAGADVFLQNLAPGAFDRLGLPLDELAERYPALIIASISGYGPGGPYRDKKAYDLLVQCEAGVVSLTGTPDTPSKAGIPVADIAAGVYAFSGILAALYERHNTGKGQILDISMLEALGEWVGFPFYYATYGGTAPERTGASHSAIAPYGPFRAGDGGQVFLAVQNSREWDALCSLVLGDPAVSVDPRFATNPLRVDNRDALTAVIEGIFSDSSTSDIVARLDTAKIANARLRQISEVIDHPQLTARDRWRAFQTETGPVKALIPPFLGRGRVPRMDPMPAAGQQSDAIRESLLTELRA
jgi:itaconate CoA-transferase